MQPIPKNEFRAERNLGRMAEDSAYFIFLVAVQITHDDMPTSMVVAVAYKRSRLGEETPRRPAVSALTWVFHSLDGFLREAHRLCQSVVPQPRGDG
jgi:hypothetical protein